MWYRYQNLTSSPTALGYLYHSNLVPVPKLHCILTACGYRYHLIWDRYQCLHNCPTSLHNYPGPPDNDDLQLSFGNQTAMKMYTEHQTTCTSIQIVEKVKSTYSIQNESKTRAGGLKNLYKCRTFMFPTPPRPQPTSC